VSAIRLPCGMGLDTNVATSEIAYCGADHASIEAD